MSAKSSKHPKLWFRLGFVALLAVLSSALPVPPSSAAVCQCECASTAFQCKLRCTTSSCNSQCNSVFQQCLDGCPPFPGSC